ncbi:MAG: type II toxin-antitoxin system VapC family toxin [Chloroflexi bacterium]|nr:type II toxin-antitoxin system VapC family toxin [Chloroflexota bacterium]
MAVEQLEQELSALKSVVLDTMVFSYHFSADPDYSPLTTVILEAIESGRLLGVTTTLTIAELLSRPEQEGNKEAAAQYEAYVSAFPNLDIIPLDVPLARLAARFHGRDRLKMPDAIQAAAAVLHNADALVTNDLEIRRKATGVKVLILNDFR